MTSWLRGRCVGKGAFGVVNAAVSRADGRVFAVKSVDRGLGHPRRLEALENEIEILKRVASPHVVAYLGDDVTFEHGGTASFRNLHLEYMPGGTVADLDRADVDESLVRRYAWCLVSALRDVHARGFVHCDVKGRNVLLSGNRAAAKLADFGSAVEVEVPQDFLPRGSPMWMAPEVVRRERQGPESDVWSLGCTVIEIVNGKPPWEDHGVDTLSRIGYSDELPEFPSKLSELGKDFLEKCLRREWRERWSCDQLLQHPFLLPYAVVESSPRCVLDWVDSEFAESEHNDLEEEGGWFDDIMDEYVVVAGSRVECRDSYGNNGMKWALQRDSGGDASCSMVDASMEEMTDMDGGFVVDGWLWRRPDDDFTLLRRDKVVVADRVWLTVEELGFQLFGKGKADLDSDMRSLRRMFR
ncbi:hypothetical protein LR48_Vigan07g112200 [Vigna angularis]|uniref:Protein kinase domain-containing protein n=1 Tax=Phaseolus angularis TaxID=3914 RepID=A0A0L9UXC9_PHAAN|nr:hypothetical protein LR48_Vigan07g112200 [Vigna angularis]